VYCVVEVRRRRRRWRRRLGLGPQVLGLLPPHDLVASWCQLPQPRGPRPQVLAHRNASTLLPSTPACPPPRPLPSRIHPHPFLPASSPFADGPSLARRCLVCSRRTIVLPLGASPLPAVSAAGRASSRFCCRPAVACRCSRSLGCRRASSRFCCRPAVACRCCHSPQPRFLFSLRGCSSRKAFDRSWPSSLKSSAPHREQAVVSLMPHFVDKLWPVYTVTDCDSMCVTGHILSTKCGLCTL
jgi:hypothetical protein